MFVQRIKGLTIVLLVTYLASNAQVGFRSGYIIKNNGDTLSGQVFYDVDGKFKKGCRFKRFEIVRAVTYAPPELTAFGFRNGRYFESKTYGNRKFFFECLIKGPVSLYSAPGREKQLYVENASTGFIRLYKDINRNKDGVHYNSFMEILTLFLGSSGSTDSSVDSAKYEAASLVALIRESAGKSNQTVRHYNPTSGVDMLTDYSITRKQTRWDVGIAGGYQFLNIHIPGKTQSRYFSEARYNTSYRPVIGVFVNHQLSKKSDLTYLDLSLLYLEDRYYGHAKYKTVSECRDDIHLKFSALQLPLSLRYMLRKEGIRPYIKAGVYISFMVSSYYNRYAERQFGSEIFTDSYSDFDIRNDLGLHGGLGIEFPLGHARKISVETEFMRGFQSLYYSSSVTFEPSDNKVITNAIGIMLRINL